MNDIAAPFRQLVERRLWPLAVLLLAALVAVPMLLGKTPAAEDVPPATAVASSAQGSTEPIVSLGDEGATDSSRKVLGSAKNPFRPAIKAKKVKAAKETTATAAEDTSSSTGGATTGGSGLPVVVGPTTDLPSTEKKTYELYSLRVRFGDSASEKLEARNLKRLTALPDSDAPALIYLGLLEDKKTAVFLVEAGAKVQGDGKCLPDLANCQTLHLKAGDTAFVDTANEAGNTVQYQLDLLKIRTAKTTDAKAAAASRSAESKSGRKALRARVSRVGRLRYDSGSGTLKPISAKAWKAAAARASAAAAAADAG